MAKRVYGWLQVTGKKEYEPEFIKRLLAIENKRGKEDGGADLQGTGISRTE